MNKKNQHPLFNAESSHYDMIGGHTAINIFEKIFDRTELMAWAKLTAMKYRLRIGNKSQVDATSDIAKIKSYEEYYKYLEGQDE